MKSLSQLYAEEDKTLAPYAMRSSQSAGRVYEDQKDVYRLPFQRDRDRIIHSKAFRRLQAKTQVFVSHYGDHYRDRMTHSIEVAHIARDLSRTLGLNEDLSECLGLAHDVGHPPFGHGGESALHEIMRGFGMHFEHNEQSRRIVEKLEKRYPHIDGLNLTKEVLDGLLKHNPQAYHRYIEFETSCHLEGQVVDIADEIAYLNHDIDDGIRSGIVKPEQLKDVALWTENLEEVQHEYPFDTSSVYPQFEEDNAELGLTLQERWLYSRTISRIIHWMIIDIQKNTEKQLQLHNIDSLEKVRAYKGKLVKFSDGMQQKVNELRKFLFQYFYFHPKVSAQVQRGQQIIRGLFDFYLQHPEKMPPMFLFWLNNGEKKEIVVKDYIAGMTDSYAEEKWEGVRNVG